MSAIGIILMNHTQSLPAQFLDEQFYAVREDELVGSFLIDVSVWGFADAPGRLSEMQI